MPMHLGDIVAPVVVATLFIIATSAFKEPQRRHFNAIMIAGAGAAYLNGGLGIWEFASLRLSPIAPTKASMHTASSASAGSSIPVGISCTTSMGIPLCLSSQRPPWDAPFVTPLLRRGVLRVRLPCTAWSPEQAHHQRLWARSSVSRGASDGHTPRRCERTGDHGVITRHLRDMYRVSPPESVHALDLRGCARLTSPCGPYGMRAS